MILGKNHNSSFVYVKTSDVAAQKFSSIQICKFA